jgi:HSP20 family protein
MATFTVSERELEDEATEVVPTVSLQPGDVGWHTPEYEGQLSVDVYQTKDTLVIKSTIAGVKPKDLEVTLNNDVITIRGKRSPDQVVQAEDYFYQECYWGGFSRSIVLPMEVRAEAVQAALKDGVLTVVLPKAPKAKVVEVKVQEEA